MKKTYLMFKFIRPLLAFITVCLTFMFAFALLYRPIPAQNVSTVNLVVGFMLGVTASVGAYYFGTSKDKSDFEQQQNFKQ